MLNNRKLAVLGCIISIPVLLYTISKAKGIGLSLTLFCSFLFFLIISRKKHSNGLDTFKTLNKSLAFYLTNTFLIGIFLIYSLNALNYTRSIEYFILVSIFSCIIAFEIWIYKKNTNSLTYIVLLQILILSASLRWGILYEFPGYVGVDPWHHSFLIENILQNGHMLPPEYVASWTPFEDPASYTLFPFYHIAVSTESIVTSLPLKQSLTLSIGIFEIASLIFVFLITRHLINSKYGLFAALFVGLSNWHIVWGFWLIPMSLGIGFFSAIVYLILRHNDRRELILTLLFTVALTLSHTLSSFVLLVTFVIFFIVNVIQTRFKRIHQLVDLRFLIVTSTINITYWIFATNFFVAATQRLVYFLSSFGSFGILSLASTTKSLIHYEYDNLGIYFLYFLTIFGSISWLNSKRSKTQYSNKIALIISSAVLFCIIYGSLFLGLMLLLPERWFPFLFILASPAMANGLKQVIRSINGKLRLTFVIIFVLFFSFTMITSGDANMDSPLFYKEEVIQYSYKESEIYALQTIDQYYNGKIYSDTGYEFDDYAWWVLKRQIDDIDFDVLDFTQLEEGVIILKKHVYKTEILLTSKNPIEELNNNYQKALEMQNTIYDNGEIVIYTFNSKS